MPAVSHEPAPPDETIGVSAGVMQAPALHSLIRFQRTYPLLQFAGCVLLFAIGVATVDSYGSGQSVRAMLVLASFLGIAAAGCTTVVLIGGLDLSIPGLIAVGNVMIAQLVGADHWSFVPALALIFVVAGILGALNGWISSAFRVNPLIVTIGMGSIALGGILVWTSGTITGSAPGWLIHFASTAGTTFGTGVPPMLILWVAIALVITFGLNRTIAGRRLYLTGANAPAADLSLVNTRRVWIAAFALSAIFAAFAGVLLAGFSGSGDSSIGSQYLFLALAAILVGGTSILGARGGYLHTVAGALMLTELTTILVGYGYDTATQQIVYGVVIFLVVAGYGRSRRINDRI
jgi:ribose transport system permease protein